MQIHSTVKQEETKERKSATTQNRDGKHMNTTLADADARERWTRARHRRLRMTSSVKRITCRKT